MATEIAYLIKRGSGRYYARYKQPNGNWTYESLGTRKRAVANERLKNFIKKLLRKSALEHDDIHAVTLADLCARHLEDVQRNQASSWHVKQKQYLEDFREFLTPGILSTDITWRHIEEFRNILRARGLKATTCNKYISSVNAMFRFAEHNRNVDVSPARRVRLLRDDSAVHDRFLTCPEFEKLMAAAAVRTVRFSTHFDALQEWITLQSFTGLRPGEIAVLEFSDIDLEHNFLRVRAKGHLGFTPKNYQMRYVPLPPLAKQAVSLMLAKRHPASDIIFHRPDGSP